jgi:ATP-dependent RNA helicase RhlE
LKFKTFSLAPQLEAGIATAGYSNPTPIQTQAIPKIMQGRDLIGLAQTGTGKTAAFVLPILNTLIKTRRGGLRALIIAPTRELAEQINQTVKDLGIKTGLKSTTVYGGVGYEPQVRSLRTSDIVVACPGRLVDHIKRNTVDLSKIETLVLDEADHMFDMGFLPDIRFILKHLPQTKRQTLLFSATMPSQIRNLAQDILKNPEQVKISHDMPAETVSHTFFPVAQNRKTELLLKLLDSERTKAVLVFTRTKHRAKQLGEKLSMTGYPSACLQGNLSQAKRQKAMDGFKSGEFKVLVATNIAARGIDVSDVSHVINFDIPSSAEDYIHRIGRTGRAERSGEAYTFFSDEDIKLAKTIRQTIGTPVQERTMDCFGSSRPAPVKNKPPKNAGRNVSARSQSEPAPSEEARRPRQPGKNRRPSKSQPPVKSRHGNNGGSRRKAVTA